MYDVIIIGAGVAGFTAGIFASRRGLKCLIIGKDVAGQANATDTIQNYPGLAETGGLELVNLIRTQAESFGAEFVQAEVSKLKSTADSFVLTAYNQQYKSPAVILAYGKTPRDLKVAGEAELKGKGVSYCASCDAPLYKNKIVAILGIGDGAADAGLLCAKYASKVYILSKTEKFLANAWLTKALFKKKNVELVPFVEIQQILGETKVLGMQLRDLKTGKTTKLLMDGIFVELGYVVDSKIFENVVKLDQQGQVIVNHDQSTSCPGIFACGDATNRPYKQAVISAGQGAAAALACFDWLQRQSGKAGLTSDWTEIKKVK